MATPGSRLPAMHRPLSRWLAAPAGAIRCHSAALKQRSHLQHHLGAANAGARPKSSWWQRPQELEVGLAEGGAQGYPPTELAQGSILTLPFGSQTISGHLLWVTAPQSDPRLPKQQTRSFACRGNSTRYCLPSPDADLSSPPRYHPQR